MSESKFKYAHWNMDKEQEAGFSRELLSEDMPDTGIETYNYPGVDTVIKGLDRTAERIPNNNCFGTRVGNEYEWMSFREARDTAINIAHGVEAFGLAPTVQDDEGKDWKFMGIQSKNRKEWCLFNLGNMRQKITSVALYDTLGKDAMRYIINQTEMTTVALSNDLINKLCQLKIDDATMDEQRLHRVANVVAFEDGVTDENKELAEKAGIKIYTMSEVVAKGKEVAATNAQLPEVVPTDVYMLSYTSGTTGDPKGVMLAHKSVMVGTFAANKRLAVGSTPLGDTDVHISYLPLAHVFEQLLQALVYQYGMACGFFGGNVLKLTEDIGILKPTFFASVPRLFNKFYDKINAKLNEATGPKGWLVQKALAAKLFYLKDGQGYNHKVYDALIFSKIKAFLGGNVRIMLTGSAPISGDVLDFLKVVFSCPLCEGYGMTESGGGSTITYANDPQTGIVGGPLASCVVKLRDIPEMNYLSTNPIPQGEVMFKGPGVMPGYYKNKEKTDECLSADGWLCSGDVGQVFPNGSLKIIDRAKNIFKLSQGEYIAPEKLENMFIKSEWIGQIWIYGDSLRDHIISFVVIDQDRLKKYCKETGKEMSPAIAEDTELRQIIFDNIIKLAIENACISLEKPKQMHLVYDPWTEAMNILTPTQKLKRNIAKEIYVNEIAAMYAAPDMKATGAKK